MVGHTGLVTKAVIPCGGSGGRLDSITEGRVLKIHLIIDGRPLIAHQLGHMKRIGIRDVKLLFRDERQIGEFEQFLDFYPALRYSPLADEVPMRHRKNRHVLGLLAQEEVAGWIGDCPVMFSLGDNFFKKGVLKRALRLFAERKTSVFVSEEFTTGVNFSPAGTVYPVETAIGMNESRNYSPAFAAFIATSEMAGFIVQEAGCGARSLFPIIRKAFENGVMSFFLHENVWNVNWELDYYRLADAATRHRFPKFESTRK